jgi:ubiquinone/menaquinone biosynthesis C-methylase UbiE
MEHLYNPFLALNEVYRTLKPGGVCVFTTPTDLTRFKSVQVSFSESGVVTTIGEPEYHGNPQHPEDGALVTWRYGYDLPYLIQKETGFNCEVRRFYDRSIAVMGYMTEVYILYK